MSKKCRLGVNVDHVATVREARQTTEPDPLPAALAAERAGADQIVIHLRKDRRHIQERDLKLIRISAQTELNLEMAAEQEMIDIALAAGPDQVTLVPEDREEVTTEGGLDVLSIQDHLEEVVDQFQNEGIRVGLFIDPFKPQIEAARDVQADAIELHTGSYAEAESRNETQEHIEQLENGAKTAEELGLYVAAGHGLTYHNVLPVADIDEIQELNIGHSIVSRSVFVGFPQAVREMVETIER